MGSSSDRVRSVEKLLRLKRYEQPPPRYFREFSGRVMARIEAGESQPQWWERFGFDLRGVLTAGAGLVACGVVLFALGLTLDGDGAAIASTTVLPGAYASEIALSSDAIIPDEQLAAVTSTNPVLTSQSAGVMNPWGIQVTPARYQLPH